MTKSLSTDQRVNLDAESRALLYQGASVNQLSLIFRMKTPDVARRLGDLKAIGTGRQNNPLYDIADAAARLIKVPVTPEMIDVYMRRVNPKDLPPITNKILWEGLAARRRYEEQVGDLWSTTDVIKVASDAFQSLRMSFLLIPDILRDETGLTETQFKRVQDIVDTALEDARMKLIDEFQKKDDETQMLSPEDI